jgi:tRNA(Ile)-lysidine synthase
MLLLAAAARAGQVETATVDHGLRTEAAAEAGMVAEICAQLGVPHSTLTVEWSHKPTTRLQERAREERYGRLNRWADERGLPAIATAHHLDDQAETLMMRVNRGAGVRGLAGMRACSTLPVPGSTVKLVRPLLGWRRAELEQICVSAGLEAAQDPSNSDELFERVRIRRALAKADWLDAEAVGRIAIHLAEADSALDWATDQEWTSQVREADGEIEYRPSAPAEIRRRVVGRAVASLAKEGEGEALRGRELDRLIAALSNGETATLRGVLCSGGDIWRFRPAPPRRVA